MERIFTGMLGLHRRPALRSLMESLAYGIVVGLLVMQLGGCQRAPVNDASAYQSPPVYTLGPGDKVRVTVFKHQDLSGVFEVDSSGRVSLPLVRGIQASGLTVVQLEDAIIARLRKERFGDTKVSVDLAKLRPVCILGEVNKPGCFDYIYGMRAAAVVAMAGGYTYRARKHDLEITRGNGATLTIDQHVLVYPGDVIEVSQRYF